MAQPSLVNATYRLTPPRRVTHIWKPDNALAVKTILTSKLKQWEHEHEIRILGPLKKSISVGVKEVILGRRLATHVKETLKIICQKKGIVVRDQGK